MEDERVQELLGRVNGMDMDVVFTPRKEPLVPPRYRLMTRDQLNKVRHNHLQMNSLSMCYLLHIGP